MRHTVYLTRETERSMIRHAVSTETAEVCGLLLGHIKTQLHDNNILVEEFVPVPNIAELPLAQFIMDPTKQLAVMESAFKCGQIVVGCFHSHPLWSNQPSETDRQAIQDNDYLWAIWGGTSNSIGYHLAIKNPRVFIPVDSILFRTQETLDSYFRRD